MPHVDINAILDDAMTYKPEVVRALRTFKKAKTFNLTPENRLACMQTLVNDMATAYGMEPIAVDVMDERGSVHARFMEAFNRLTGTLPPVEENTPTYPASGASNADPSARKIHMVGKLSIITLLHEFAHIRFGTDELKCQRWAVNLFRKVYPKQFAKLVFNGWAFVKPSATVATPAVPLLRDPVVDADSNLARDEDELADGFLN
jgi:hypothetical protein